MERSMAEKYRRENRPVWFMETWSGMSAKARITDICKDGQAGEYAKVNCIHDEECDAYGSQGVFFKDLYPSKELLLQDAAAKEQARVNEIKASIQTMEDCIQFMFGHTVSHAEEYTDWTARRAVKELAAERWGLELD